MEMKERENRLKYYSVTNGTDTNKRLGDLKGIPKAE